MIEVYTVLNGIKLMNILHPLQWWWWIVTVVSMFITCLLCRTWCSSFWHCWQVILTRVFVSWASVSTSTNTITSCHLWPSLATKATVQRIIMPPENSDSVKNSLLFLHPSRRWHWRHYVSRCLSVCACISAHVCAPMHAWVEAYSGWLADIL